MKKENEIVRYDLNDKNDLFKYIKECEKKLGQCRLKWFLGTWLGYSVFFFFINNPREINDISELVSTVIYSVVLGLILWFAGVIVWPHYVNSLRDKTKYVEEIKNKFYNMK